MESAKAEVLIVQPDRRSLGGIQAYYSKVGPHLETAAECFEIGRREGRWGSAPSPLRLLLDCWRLHRRLSDPAITVVHLNPSLKLDMVLREGLMQRLARARGRRTLVFWRGWESGLARRIGRRWSWLFRRLYGNADAFVVLAEEFRRQLLSWGIRRPIHQEVVVIADEVVAGLEVEDLIRSRLSSRPRRILFLARLLREKGIHETLRALPLLPGRPLELVVAGEGPELEPARELVARERIAGVVFLGQVSGERKWELLRQASLLCLPTRHAEGLSNSVVEAMGFGLPVVTTPVGGVVDFFRDGVHGCLLEGGEPPQIASAIARLLEDPDFYASASRRNFELARQRFLASQAARRLDAIYRSLQKSTV